VHRRGLSAAVFANIDGALADEVKSCLLCRSADLATSNEGERVVTASCRSCGAVVRVEFDPPDDPTLRGRIEVLADPLHKTYSTDPMKQDAEKRIVHG